MNISRTSVVHPVAELPPPPPPLAVNGNGNGNVNGNGNGNANNLLRYARMKDLQGMPGTKGGLVLRLFQFVFALVSFCVMVTTNDFADVSAFRYLVVAAGLQSLWSLSLAVLDTYALLVGRRLQNHKIIIFFSLGDGITSTLTFAAACASAGVTFLLRANMELCSVNPCARFESATLSAFLTWFAGSPSFVLNFWRLALHSR